MATTGDPDTKRLYKSMVWQFPVEPLAMIVDRALASGWTRDNLARATGWIKTGSKDNAPNSVDPRAIYAVQTRAGKRVNLAVADAICCALMIHLGDVYPNDYWRTTWR